VRILIVEDHVLFREMMRSVCVRDFGWEVVAETGSGDEAVKLAKECAPDVVILDLQLADRDGFEVAEEVLRIRPGIGILVVSSHCDEYTLYRVERAGVHGFLDKNTNTPETLRSALTLVSQGQCFYSRMFREAKLARHRNPDNFAATLTEWERVILGYIGQSLSDDEISERLGIRPKTVMTHRSKIMKKVGVSGTPKLIRYAIEHGFTQLPPQRVDARHSHSG
jgi:DNA-binding NarL/FixJ family response regulator